MGWDSYDTPSAPVKPATPPATEAPATEETVQPAPQPEGCKGCTCQPPQV